MTLNEISSIIRNRISDGLSGNITNVAYSLEQIEAEIGLTRSTIIDQFKKSGVKFDRALLTQTLDRLCIECRDLGMSAPSCLSAPSTGMGVPSVKIPAPTGREINFVGTVDKMHDFLVYYDVEDIQNHQYRPRTSKYPFVWADLGSRDADGMVTLYFFNMGAYESLKYVTVRGIYDNPMAALHLNPEYGEMEYPAPNAVIDAIIETLVNKYTRDYRQLNIPPLPNTQSDPVT